MAIYFPSVGDGLTRNGSFLDPALSWTRARRVKFVTVPSSPSNYQVIWQLGGGTPPSTETPPWIGSFTDAVGSDIYTEGDAGSGAAFDSGQSWLPVFGTWGWVFTTYDSATHQITTWVNAVPSSAGTLDLSGMAAQAGEWLGTDSVGLGGFAVAYARDWQALLTQAEMQAEMNSATAVRTADLLADTPLPTTSALSDISGNGHGWTLVGTPTTVDGSVPVTVTLAALPESADTFFCGSDGATTGMNPAPGGALTPITLCATRAGKFWQLCDNSMTSGSTLRLLNPSTGAADSTVECATRLGSVATFPVNYHQLHELSNGNVLTNVRGTGALVEVSTLDGSIAKTYALSVTSLDAALNSPNTFLLYFYGQDLKRWDLTNDADGGTLFSVPPSTDGAPPCMPVWLPDCTVLVCQPPDSGSPTMPILRYNTSGAVVQTYLFDRTLFDEDGDVLYGLQANYALNRLWVMGEPEPTANPETLVIQAANLSTGAVDATAYLAPQADSDIACALAVVYETNTCTGAPSPPLPGPIPPPDPNTWVTTNIRWERVSPHLTAEQVRTIYDMFQVDAQFVGTVDCPNPVMVLQYSDDGGYTWSNEIELMGGQPGDYLAQFKAFQLGQARDRVFKVWSDAPVPTTLLAAYLRTRKGTS